MLLAHWLFLFLLEWTRFLHRSQKIAVALMPLELALLKTVGQHPKLCVVPKVFVSGVQKNCHVATVVLSKCSYMLFKK
ncbi:hypothetical protein PAHAL_8G240000 [Panicum hallii]|uniref:Secreted protein n=1 Tax=Panicum hallii TaxID=206008 RepID=A0A2T8IA37_9POAL|nr:hypothetical protein PAHAL_8G240000 [Panicum hallii]